MLLGICIFIVAAVLLSPFLGIFILAAEQLSPYAASAKRILPPLRILPTVQGSHHWQFSQDARRKERFGGRSA